MINVTGTRMEIIISTSGMAHAPKRNAITGAYVRRYGWRVTACGQIAEGGLAGDTSPQGGARTRPGWSQRRRFGYVDCRNCIKRLEGLA